MLLVANSICSDWGMVASIPVYQHTVKGKNLGRSHAPNLLTDQAGLAQLRVRTSQPLSYEQFTQERVERFLLTAELLTTAAVLLVQGREEPFEHKKSALLRISLSRGRHKYSRVFSPVGRVFGKRGGGEDEWRGSQ